MAPRNRRPNKKKPSRATTDATDALFRPLPFPTSVEAVLGELDPGHDAR